MISNALSRLSLTSLVALAACGLPSAVQPSSTQLHPLGGKSGTPRASQVNHDDGNGPVPASADISQFNPPVGNQGQIGDCTTWAFGYGLGGYLARQAGSAEEFAPMYIFTQLAPSGSTDFGISAQEAFQLMQSGGIDTAADYDASVPAKFTDNGASLPGLGDDAAANDTVDAPSTQAKQNATHFTLTSFTTVFSTYPQGSGVCPGYPGGTTPIQSAIANGSPVVVTIPVPPEFDNYDSVHPVVPPTPTEVSRGEHLLLCTKYDAAGLWCQNSWGLDWGKQGWVQLAWSFVEQCVVETDTAAGMTSIPQPQQTNTAPTPTIVSPSNGSVVTGTVTVTVQVAQGSNPIATVALVGNGTQWGSQSWTAQGVAWTLDSTLVANGSLALTAVATDSAGVQGTSTPVTVTVSNAAPAPIAPTPSFTSPANGATLSGTVTVTVQVAQGTNPIATVALLGNGTQWASQAWTAGGVSWSLDTTQVANGNLTLTVIAADSTGVQGTGTVLVTVANATPAPTGPTLTITSPAESSSVSGTVTVTVQITPGGAGIASCTLSANGQVLGQQTTNSSEFDTVVDTTQLANGALTFSASCTDTNARTGTATVDVTVAN